MSDRDRLPIHLMAVSLSMLLLAAPASAGDSTSFTRDVMAVLSKAGCNLGTCHGNQNGKGGFKLSLRGENPDADFESLTRGLNGRRLNVVAPDDSLILQKPTLQVPHEGALRFRIDSPEYALLRRWIEAGAPTANPQEPALVRLEVSPREQVIVEPADQIAMSAIAIFADGSTRDVTRLACFEPSQPTVEISLTGLVRRATFGELTVSVRYLDQQQPVRLAFIPARPDFSANSPAPANYIDEHVFAKLQSLQINPSAVCDDVTFLRRAFLDLLGIVPNADEACAFANDTRPDKRERLIDSLLDRGEFADFWAIKWGDLLRVEERTLDRKGTATFHAWIRDSLATNKPVDLFVRELITARGSTYDHPPANFYRALRDPATRAEAVAQVFLGIRLQCTKCHNHPFDRWTQTDYYGWANNFGEVNYEILENRRRDRNDSHEFDGEQIVYIGSANDVKHPATDKIVAPRFLETNVPSPLPPGEGGRRPGEGSDGPRRPVADKSSFPTPSLRPSPQGRRSSDNATDDRLIELANWLTSQSNRRFAEMQANRVWFHLMGRGIIDPIDDFRATNPPSNPALLQALTDDFIAHEFDLWHLIRTIMASRTYQLSSAPNSTNADDASNFSHAAVRRLSAEQLADSFARTLDVSLSFSGYPPGTRAAQLSGVRVFRQRDGDPARGDQFLTAFGKPPRLQSCDCERAEDATLSQAFQLISGPILNDLLTQPNNHLRTWLSAESELNARIDDLFLTVLSRRPTPSEHAAASKLLAPSSKNRANMEDVVWSLLNSHEFLMRH